MKSVKNKFDVGTLDRDINENMEFGFSKSISFKIKFNIQFPKISSVWHIIIDEMNMIVRNDEIE